MRGDGLSCPSLFLAMLHLGRTREPADSIELFHPIGPVLLPSGGDGGGGGGISEAGRERRIKSEGRETRRRQRGQGRREGGKRNKKKTARRSIPPATAYAFIIIYEFPRRAILDGRDQRGGGADTISRVDGREIDEEDHSSS